MGWTRLCRAALCTQLVVGALARTASAQEQAHDTALAHDLFDEGRALMARKQYEPACEKFEASRKVDPGHAGGTLLNLALCRESSGKTATAWALFREARAVAVRDRREDRREFAESHIAALAPRLSRLRINVSERARVPGLVVKRNGVVLAESAWGEALIADPGPQIVDVTAPGRRSLHLVPIVPEGASREVAIPPLDMERSGNAAEPSQRDPSFFAGSQRKLAVGVSAAGLFGAGVGAMFGVLAVRKQHDANVLCPDYDRCDPRGLTLSSDAANDARIATTLIVSGAVVVGIGVVLFLTAPHAARREAATVTATLSGRGFVPAVRF